MKNLLRVCCLGVTLLTCAKENGVTMEIVRTLAVNAAGCSYDIANGTLDRGLFDPSGGVAYTLGVEIRNNAEAEDADPSLGFAGQNQRSRTNDILLTGFEACWYRTEDQDPTKQPDCSKLPKAQQGTLPTAVTINRQTSTAVTAAVLTKEQLQSLYGAAFDATAIPQGGISSDGSTRSFAAENPAAGGRSAAWGTYPAQLRDTIIIQARAVGTMQGGTKLRSQWLRFPVELCIRCFARCGTITKTTCKATDCTDQAASTTLPCSNPCGGTDVCDLGECPNGAACGLPQVCKNINGSQNTLGILCFPNRKVFSEPTLDFSTACLPYQGFVQPTCTVPDACKTFLAP